MSSRPRRLKAADVVEVRSAEEILATLAADATLDGLPLMPEMLGQCGARFTVASRADTTCFYGSLLHMPRAVHLTGVRCDGSAHGGCQAGCLVFWKEEWLRPVDGTGGPVIAAVPPVRRSECTPEDVQRATHAPHAPDGEERWSCQATQVRTATTRIQHWDLRHFARDVRNGNLRARTVLRYLLPYLVNTYQGVSRTHLPPWLRFRGGVAVPFVHGRLVTTPSAHLGLQPGETVQVRSRAEIRGTLDGRGRNRGLSFDVEMVPYCGQTLQVKRRVSRVIDEWSGRMLELPGECVVLAGAVCQGLYHGLCTRQTDTYWREIWLTRDQSAGNGS